VNLYKTIADNTFDWEIFRDKDNKIVYIYKAFERITGRLQIRRFIKWTNKRKKYCAS